MNERKGEVVLVVVLGNCEDVGDAEPEAKAQDTGGSRYNSAAYRDNHERIFGSKNQAATLN